MYMQMIFNLGLSSRIKKIKRRFLKKTNRHASSKIVYKRMFDQFLEIVRENYRLSVDFKISQENTVKCFFTNKFRNR